MNLSHEESPSLRPNYMSQAEANEVMELWAQQQREEAARQSLITVHDVAEATQLSTQDVERLLQDVRRKQGTNETPYLVSTNFRSNNSTGISLKDAYLRLMPLTGLVSAVLCACIKGWLGDYADEGANRLRFLAFVLMVYAFVAAVVWVVGLVRSALGKSHTELLSQAPELRR